MASPAETERRAVAEAIAQGKLIFALRKDLIAAVGGISGGVTGAFTPYFIPDGETFTVPENKQVLWNATIDVEGTLDVEGLLIYVN